MSRNSNPGSIVLLAGVLLFAVIAALVAVIHRIDGEKGG